MRRNMNRLAVKLAEGAIAVTQPPHRGRALSMAFIATCVAVFTLTAVRVYDANAAPLSPRHASKYYPPLMQNWGVFGPLKTSGSNAKFAIGLLYPGFVGSVYPSVAKNHDTIPAMWTKLLLPAGMKLMSSSGYVSHFWDVGYRNQFGRRIPKMNLRWSLVHSVPVWKVLNVNGGVQPRVTFWVTGQPGQCFISTTQGMYHKKVKRGNRHVRVWSPIPHAPVQKAQACLPGDPSTTTTTG